MTHMIVRNLWVYFDVMTLYIHQVKQGDSIASEGKGDYLFVEGRVLDLQGKPIPGAIIETWETDSFGLYDNQVRILFRRDN